MLIVKKFGGSSVANQERIENVARKCKEEYEKKNQVVVVLSAMGDYTDEIIAKAKSIHENPPKRELDMLLTTGEQISVSLLAMALDQMEVPAISLNAFQVPMYTTACYGNARIKEIDTQRIKNELEQRKVVIVTGFQGIDEYNNYTTLGRGGSDTTAVSLAAKLHADLCEIYTDVDGVYAADPRKIKKAKKLKEISYDEMLEFASLGAGVLHNRSVEMAKKYHVTLVVRSSFSENEGTVIKGGKSMEKMLVSGVTSDQNITNISVRGMEAQKGGAFQIFGLLAQKQINVDIILQSEAGNGKMNVSFTIDEENEKEACELLQEHLQGFDTIESESSLAKVSIVGAGMMTNPGVAARMFEALHEAGITIRLISTSEIKVSVVIDQKQVQTALEVLSQKFSLVEG